MHLTALFDLSLVGRADRDALDYVGADGTLRMLTFGQIDARANQMAHELTARGLAQGDRLCVHLANRIEFIDLFLACARLGVVFVPMNVLVGIEVSRIPIEEPAERGELAVHFLVNRNAIVQRDHLINRSPAFLLVGVFTKIDVQADAQVGMRAGQASCRGGRRPADHQAGAGHDAALVRLDDTTVHTWTLAEIVRINNQKPRHPPPRVRAHKPSFSANCIASSNQPWACSGGGVQFGDQPSHWTAKCK